MIRKVKFSNFYSFNESQEIDFLAKKKETYDYYTSKSNDQITKIAGFIGGNASGKTNVMRFFSFLSYFVCRRIDNRSHFIPDIAYKTFFNSNKPSKFYIEFENSGSIFFYDVSLKRNTNAIIKEELSVKKIEKSARKVKVFLRGENSIMELNKNYFENISTESLPKIRRDVSFVAFIKNLPYNVEIINEVYDYFSRFRTNINEMGEIINQISELGIYFEDKKIRKEMDGFIRLFDIGLSGFDIIKKEEMENKSLIPIRGTHITNGKKCKLSFEYESRGTRSLFFAMANILSALKNNTVVIVDEIESGFHPEALNKLIGFFIEQNREKTAQLIFSSHSLGFMNKLDMHQIYLVEKNDECESKAFRLNEVEGIRSDENFLSKYMSGSYGAFPKIRI